MRVCQMLTFFDLLKANIKAFPIIKLWRNYLIKDVNHKKQYIKRQYMNNCRAIAQDVLYNLQTHKLNSLGIQRATSKL